MIRILIGLAACTTMLPAPARAADLATLGCVEGKLDAVALDGIAKDVEANLQEAGQRGSYSPPTVQVLKDAGAACGTANGWSPAATRAAILYTLAKFSLPVVQQDATDRGLDPAALEALWLALPEEKRNKPLAGEDYRALADAAVPEGDQRTQATGALLHTFFEFESILQYASVDFSAS